MRIRAATRDTPLGWGEGWGGVRYEIYTQIMVGNMAKAYICSEDGLLQAPRKSYSVRTPAHPLAANAPNQRTAESKDWFHARLVPRSANGSKIRALQHDCRGFRLISDHSTDKWIKADNTHIDRLRERPTERTN